MDKKQGIPYDLSFEAIYDCLQEIIDTLCFQPDIPLQHKTDMLNKLGKVAETYYKIKEG